MIDMTTDLSNLLILIGVVIAAQAVIVTIALTRKKISEKRSRPIPYEKKKFCPNCGAELPPKDKVCGKCGREVAESYRELGSSFYRLGLRRIDERDYPQADHYFDEALKIFRKIEDQPNIAVVLDQLAMVRERQGTPAEAERLRSESLKIRRKLGDGAQPS